LGTFLYIVEPLKLTAMEGQREIQTERPHKAQSREGKYEPCKEPELEPITIVAMEYKTYIQFIEFLTFYV